MKTIKFLPAIFASLVVAACGGGGSSTPASNTISGIAAKGPIGTAEVLVFKAGDYSSSADDAKALNASTPAATDSTGHYSVNIGGNSGPVIIVVRPKSTGSTMCNELTGNCALAFNFRMRAALASVAANTTAHITPFTEMAAKAVGTSTNPAVFNIANALVRTKVLPGLDPLTTSPVVDSRVPTTEQSAQRQMVVALAAVAQAGNSTLTNTAGTTCSTLAVGAAQIACAVDALSNTMGSATATGATIDGSKVAAFNTAMGSLTTINVPTLNSSGNLTTTTTLDTTTDTDASMLETGVATNSTNLGTSTTTQTPPSTTVLSGVDKAKAFFSDLRTTLHLFSNGTRTGFLDNQATRIQTDMASVIGPDMTKATNRLDHMMSGADLLGQSVNTSKNGGSFPNDWKCSVSATDTNSVTCKSRSGYSPFGVTTNYLNVVIIGTGTNQASYNATAMQCTSDGTGSSPGNWAGCSDTPIARSDKATGSGTLAYTLDGSSNLTGLTVTGTFPGSNTGDVQDSVALNGSLTGPANGNQRVDFSGSVSSYGGTGTTANATPNVTLAIGSGSYATDQQVLHTQFVTGYTWTGSAWTPTYTQCVTTTTYSCTWPELSAVNVILVANTPDTKFTGTFTASNAMFDASGTQWIPTTAVFNGSIADTSTSGAGTFMTGKLELATSNYNTISAPTQGSGNSLLATAKFTGTLAFPGAQSMGLVLAGSKTGVSTGTTSVNFSYGNGKTISVTSAPINSASTSNTVTLTNQDGLMVTLTQGQNAAVKVGSDTVATVGNNNMINYSDGYVESIN